MVFLITFLILLVLTIVTGVLISNNLIAKRNRTAQAYGSLEVYLKKRYDLIPNLVATVNNYTLHERELLTEIVQVRESLMQQGDNADMAATENQLTDLLRKVQVQVENYPELKADKQFLSLQWSLADIEDQLSAARRAFNAAVTEFNNAIEIFPNNIIAGMKRYNSKALLKIPEKEQQYVSVEDLFGKQI